MISNVWAGTKILIDGKAVGRVLSLEIRPSGSEDIKAVSITLQLDSLHQDEDGNLTFKLIGND